MHSQWYLPTSLTKISAKKYVYLQREAPTILDVLAEHTILRVKKVLPSDLLLLKGKDGREYCKHSKNCTPCHLSIEGTVHHELAIILEGLSYCT